MGSDQLQIYSIDMASRLSTLVPDQVGIRQRLFGPRTPLSGNHTSREQKTNLILPNPLVFHRTAHKISSPLWEITSCVQSTLQGKGVYFISVPIPFDGPGDVNSPDLAIPRMMLNQNTIVDV